MTAEYTLQHRIAGDACDAAQGEWFEKFEPCTGHLLARVAAGTGADVDRAARARGIRRRILAPLARRGAGEAAEPAGRPARA